MEQYLRQGLMPDSKVLDIRQVDVSTGRFLEDNTPVFVITFTTQEVLLFRDRKTRDVAVGAENRVEQCNYAAVVTRVEEELENELTGGWKVIEVSLFFFPFILSCWDHVDDAGAASLDGASVRARIFMTWPCHPLLPPLPLWGLLLRKKNPLHRPCVASCFIANPTHTTHCHRTIITITTREIRIHTYINTFQYVEIRRCATLDLVTTR
jgi:hypothetical protein